MLEKKTWKRSERTNTDRITYSGYTTRKSESLERKRTTGKQETSPRNRTEIKGGAAAPSLCIGQAVRLRAGFRREWQGFPCLNADLHAGWQNIRKMTGNNIVYAVYKFRPFKGDMRGSLHVIAHQEILRLVNRAGKTLPLEILPEFCPL